MQIYAAVLHLSVQMTCWRKRCSERIHHCSFLVRTEHDVYASDLSAHATSLADASRIAVKNLLYVRVLLTIEVEHSRSHEHWMIACIFP